jgi:hypothetical protein
MLLLRTPTSKFPLVSIIPLIFIDDSNTLFLRLHQIDIPPVLMSNNPINSLLNIIKDTSSRELLTIPLTLEIPRPHQDRIPSKLVGTTNIYVSNYSREGYQNQDCHQTCTHVVDRHVFRRL